MHSTSDIIVIGAGIVGCAVGYELARRGASVQIVDDRPAGMGATQAAAGVLAPYIEARENESLTALATHSLEMYDTFVGSVRADSGAPILYRRTGTLDVALDEAGFHRLEAAAADLASRGVVAELLAAAAVHAEEPQVAGGASGGLYIPSHGFVAAGELTRALLAGARRHRARVVDSGRVTRISRIGGGLAVEIARETLAAHGVVVAAGSWSGQLTIEGITARVPIRPVRGQLLQLEWRETRLRRVTWGERCYLVPWEDGSVLVGATVEDAGFDERTTVAGVRELIDAACELVPQTRTAALMSAKVGLRPASADGLPVIGASVVSSHLIYATGHYRNGILLAPLTARLVADAMLERRIDPLMALTSPQRFGEL